MSNDTTGLFELPDKKNVTFNIQENDQSTSLDSNTIHSLVNGLQAISETGLTKLPSRDISMDTDNIVIDQHIKPNYVPTQPNTNYIPQQSIDNIILKEQHTHTFDDYYTEFQTSILISILYFLFQLPIIKNKIQYFLPFLFHIDSSYNIKGLFFISILFGVVFYLINKFINLSQYL
jgi:hypothetical protein